MGLYCQNGPETNSPAALSRQILGPFGKVSGTGRLFVSLFNVIVLNHTPEWVRARVLAVSMLMFQGAMAVGSAAWGAVATRAGVHISLIWAGAGMLLSTTLGLFLKLPEPTVDVTPWVHWRQPTILRDDVYADDSGPILVTVKYNVEPGKKAEFIEDGAYRWGIFQDLEAAGRYVETFLVISWAEHLRHLTASASTTMIRVAPNFARLR